MNNHLCQVKDCKCNATFTVSFLLRFNDRMDYICTSPILYTCNEHNDVEWKDVVDEKSWRELQMQFERDGMTPPLEKYSAIDISPMTLRR